MTAMAASGASVPERQLKPFENPARRHNEGHGRRLTAAFEALESYPVLVESRNRVLRLFEAGRPSLSDIVAAVEADLALTVTVVRLANQIEGPTKGRVESVVTGVEVLSIETVHAIATRARTFDFFERTAMWQGIPERLRLHAIATQRAADRLARESGYEARDRLMVTSLLHDIGKLVLVHAYPGYPDQVHGLAGSPEDRLRADSGHAIKAVMVTKDVPTASPRLASIHFSRCSGGEVIQVLSCLPTLAMCHCFRVLRYVVCVISLDSPSQPSWTRLSTSYGAASCVVGTGIRSVLQVT